MLFIVAWLLLYRLEDVKECLKKQARVRYYFLLTLSGIAVNLLIGICGTINVTRDPDDFL